LFQPKRNSSFRIVSEGFHHLNQTGDLIESKINKSHTLYFISRMSTKKLNLVNQLRLHYQKKFGNITLIQNLLEVELAKLNEKEKISANVINS